MGIIKKAYEKISYTHEQLEILEKCANDEIFFLEQTKIQHPVKGAIPLVLYPFQKKIIETYNQNNNVILLCSRQMAKTLTTSYHLLYEAMFKSDQTIVIIANKLSNAIEIMKRIRFCYEELPDYIRPGVITYNKGHIEFDNGSRIIVRAANSHAIRGLSVNYVYLDELAFVPDIHDDLKYFFNKLQKGLGIPQ